MTELLANRVMQENGREKATGNEGAGPGVAPLPASKEFCLQLPTTNGCPATPFQMLARGINFPAYLTGNLDTGGSSGV